MFFFQKMLKADVNKARVSFNYSRLSVIGCICECVPDNCSSVLDL